jgi:hypothetical protein
MKNKKLTAGAWIVSCVLATKKEAAGQQDIPVKKPPPKKSAVKTPGTFVPTDKVSSDQAVAFPTDM